MRQLRLWAGVLTMAVAAPILGACGHTREASGEVAPSNAIGLSVRNENFLDMDVYAVSAGLSTRLGSVTGNSSRTFVLNATMASGQDFRIVATPIGGSGRASTGTLAVNPGQTIEFRIGSQLSNSTVFIR